MSAGHTACFVAGAFASAFASRSMSAVAGRFAVVAALGMSGEGTAAVAVGTWAHEDGAEGSSHEHHVQHHNQQGLVVAI